MATKPRTLPVRSRLVVEQAVDLLLDAQGHLSQAMLNVGIDDREAVKKNLMATAHPIGTAQRALDALLAKNVDYADKVLAADAPEKARKSPANNGD